MGSNPVEALKFFFLGCNLQLLKLRLQLRWSNLYFICIPAVHIIFILSTLSNHFITGKKIFAVQTLTQMEGK